MDFPADKRAVSTATLVRNSLVVGGLLVLALAAWALADVLLLAFAAVLFAIVLRALADPLERHLPIGSAWALLAAVMVLACVIAGFAWLLGTKVQSETRSLLERMPELLSALGDRIGVEDLEAQLAERTRSMLSSSGLAGRVASYTSAAIGIIANAVLVLVAGVYLARHPKRYRAGLLYLAAPSYRREWGRFLDNTGRALRLWLLGQVVSMLLVGTLTLVGLYAIGMPSPLALALIAGLLEFVPLLGPVLSAIPAILFAVSEGGTMVLWVIGLYLLIQQVEGNLIMPLVQRRAVDLPPVLSLFAILSFGLLFGVLGILLSTPLAVVVYVAVKQLYLRDALDEDVTVPGEPASR